MYLGQVQVAKPEAGFDAARNDVVSPRIGLNLANGADLTAGERGGNPIDRLNVFGRGEQCVVPLIHGRRTRVIGDACDRHIPPMNADDALDHADVDLFLVQRAALLNMQFDIAREVTFFANRTGEFIRIAADELNALADGFLAAGDNAELFFGQATRDRLAAAGPALFVLENNNLERMPQPHVILRQRLCHLDRSHRADLPVIHAARRNRVDM